jgi:uncharacterized RDD family membrane protein YckC
MLPEAAVEILYCSECGHPTPVDDLAHFAHVLVCPNCKNRYAQKLREGAAPNLTAGGSQYCGFWIRFVATLIDSIIVGVFNSILQLLAMKPLLTAAQAAPDADPKAAFAALGIVGILSLVSMVVNCLYETLFIAKMGSTPGKMAFGMRVVRPDGSRIGMARSFGRYFAKLLSALIIGIGYVVAAFDSEKRALHDMICDTRVVKQGY